MLIDLHNHTRPLSHDSLITADDLIVAAKERGLDAVCLTEHDFFWDVDEVRSLSKRHNFPAIPGVELNTEDGHFVAFGLEKWVYGMHRTDELVAMVKEAPGALIAAHPYRRQLPFELKTEGDWSEAFQSEAFYDNFLAPVVDRPEADGAMIESIIESGLTCMAERDEQSAAAARRRELLARTRVR